MYLVGEEAEAGPVDEVGVLPVPAFQPYVVMDVLCGDALQHSLRLEEVQFEASKSSNELAAGTTQAVVMRSGPTQAEYVFTPHVART